MKWWREFLKKRKQSDRVKVMVIFLLAGIGFMGDFICRGIQVYETAKSPVEYVFGSVSDELKDSQIAEIRGLDNVKAVSRQREISVTLECGRTELTFSCLELSENYLQAVYGIRKKSSMKVFYLNQTAWEQIMKSGKGETENKEVYLKYVMAGRDGTKTAEGTAKAVLLDRENSDEQPCVYCKGTGEGLANGSDMVRVQTKRQDLTGSDLGSFRQIGLELVNTGEVRQAEMLLEMQYMRMKYDIFITIISFIFAAYLRKGMP